MVVVHLFVCENAEESIGVWHHAEGEAARSFAVSVEEAVSVSVSVSV